MTFLFIRDHETIADRLIRDRKTSFTACHAASYIDGSVQDCSIFIPNALKVLQSCTKPSICASPYSLTQFPGVATNANVVLSFKFAFGCNFAYVITESPNINHWMQNDCISSMANIMLFRSFIKCHLLHLFIVSHLPSICIWSDAILFLLMHNITFNHI